ncbi:ISNCY family transposase, partial [Sinorhizobium medicae]|nr:ISNCY family transposase [Sinorhizobium meliloti]MDX0445310.1 ISNCY family transposase [Sinorhizobium medicae]MDX0027426.1 ISNCY family transposase [Sinorhizobium meliloti]MDX0070800.1 ISNCY family transposase [Sinorhizobium meliloti]MDX0253305.1 ISNCY family transposase [Sinorhizobium meliloti]
SEKIGYRPRGRKPGKRTDFTNDPAVVARRRQALSQQSAVEQGQPYPAQFNGE